MPGPQLWLHPDSLVLASRSAGRVAVLGAAGIPLEIHPADVDERIAEQAARDQGASAAEVAIAVARSKAAAVSALRPGRLVLGSDQTLSSGGQSFHKPADRLAAARQLRALSGVTHDLHSAAVLMRDGVAVFQTVSTAHLRMRGLSDDMITRYLEAAGDAVLGSVGAYQLEGLGIHLFEAIEGDHFTILGLPLMQLLAFFRQAGLAAQ